MEGPTTSRFSTPSSPPTPSSFPSSDSETEPPPLRSFEDVAHRLAKPYLFVDLQGLPRNHWMRREAAAWPLGYNASRTRWDLTLDAFFFIDMQEPDVKVGAEAGSSGEERPAGQRPARRRCPTIPEG